LWLWSELAKSHECSSALGIHKFIGTFNINFISSIKNGSFFRKKSGFCVYLAYQLWDSVTYDQVKLSS
jgi:hypothetical protein